MGCGTEGSLLCDNLRKFAEIRESGCTSVKGKREKYQWFETLDVTANLTACKIIWAPDPLVVMKWGFCTVLLVVQTTCHASKHLQLDLIEVMGVFWHVHWLYATPLL
jgi:hypothetical protein